MHQASCEPLVFAHRGASATLPEHTLAAYQLALDLGVDGLECDVRLTRDGHLVCLHDRRLNRTSNGRGLVSERTLDELDQLDFGSWHPALPDSADQLIFDRAEPGDSAPVLDDRGRVLTLDRLITVAGQAGRPVRLLVETKHPTRYGAAVERALVALLSRRDLPGVEVTAMSFSPRALRTLRTLAPDLPTVLLLEFMPPGLPMGRLPFGARIAGPGIALVRSRPVLV
ncbi:MAG TPA: glycerophosphodiester phosphodiesterase family protein, partial [Micromonosporaceae bacterium]|nr:glycerophosphodiester phosphodiesterase family protein [Micromonosporaceae bacterium]